MSREGQPAVAGGQVNAPGWRLSVWNYNSHSGDPTRNWRLFLDEIATRVSTIVRPYIPDIVTVQEVQYRAGGIAHVPCSDLVDELRQATGGKHYRCTWATAPTGRNNGTGPTQGGAAIIYRPSRLTFLGQTMFPLQSNKVDSDGNPLGCEVRDNDGADQTSVWTGVAARFGMTVGTETRHLTVATAHMPTQVGLGDQYNHCIYDNTQAAIQATKKLDAQASGSSQLRIISGDFNMEDRNSTNRWRHWYKRLNRRWAEATVENLGMDDIAEKACHPSGATDAMVRTCLDRSGQRGTWWTVAHRRRIDYIWTINSASFANQETIAQTRPAYSDHRGLGATLELSAP
jgi:endonuclease/exonuclease/phosphatase family metal-dependent hydrolase